MPTKIRKKYEIWIMICSLLKFTVQKLYYSALESHYESLKYFNMYLRQFFDGMCVI